MTGPSTRRALIAGAAALAAPALRAQPAALEILSADIRPLSIPDGERRGIVLDVVAEAARAVGREARFTFLPFPEAVERTRTVPGTAMAPLGRVSSREGAFAWVGKVVDVPQAIGTLADRPTADLAAARALGRVGVIRAGLQEAFLRENGFGNLVVMETGRDLALALAERRVDAWYSTAPEIVLQFEAIGRAGQARVGPALQAAPAWLAANLDPGDLPLDALRAALTRLEADGTAARVYERYVPG